MENGKKDRTSKEEISELLTAFSRQSKACLIVTLNRNGIINTASNVSHDSPALRLEVLEAAILSEATNNNFTPEMIAMFLNHINQICGPCLVAGASNGFHPNQNTNK